jgi:hypothetical protein
VAVGRARVAAERVERELAPAGRAAAELLAGVGVARLALVRNVAVAVPPRDRLEHELVDEALELGLDLPLDERGELAAVHLERSCDGRFDSTGEHVRHLASVRRVGRARRPARVACGGEIPGAHRGAHEVRISGLLRHE